MIPVAIDTKKSYPVRESEDEPRQPDGGSRHERRGSRYQSPLKALYLQQILCNRPNLDVVLVGLTDATQEVDRVGIAQVPVQRFENIALSLQDLSLGVGSIRTIGGIIR